MELERAVHLAGASRSVNAGHGYDNKPMSRGVGQRCQSVLRSRGAAGAASFDSLEKRLESWLGQWLGCAHGKTVEGESTDGDLAVHQHRKEPVAEFGEFFVLFVAVYHLQKEWGSFSIVGLGR